MDQKSWNEKSPVWVLPNIWRLGRVRDTKFDSNVSNKMLLNEAKCQDYSFYQFLVIKGLSFKFPPPPLPPRLGLEYHWGSLENLIFRGRLTKNQYIGWRDCPKTGLGQFCRFKRWLVKKRGWCFWGPPQCKLWLRDYM